ncbi:MAG: hypothetical protein KDD82_22365 [Planctomycetes bacterium]|nr:hypothetical protein [Planctomycetota bacterium]
MATQTHDKTLVRLEVLPQQASRLTVDRSYPGRIEGVSLITSGPAAGHGFDVDRTTVEQVTEFAEGMRGRWTHSDLSADGLGRHLGRWQNVHSEPFLLCRTCGVEAHAQACPECGKEPTVAWRSVGDFAFDRTAYTIRPDGLDVPAPVYLMDRAEEDPRSLGISVVARFGFEAAEDAEVTRARIASRRDLLRGDWVADPAANPIGLHAGTDTPSELTEGAVRALDRIVARIGREQAKTRALAFLARYFGDAFEEEEHAEAALPEPELGALRARVDALRSELEALRQTVAAYRQAEEARRQEEGETFLAMLRTEAAALNAPIPAADLAKVEALLEAGDADTARLLGQAFLARSEALGQEPFQRGGVQPLAESHDAKKASVAARARVLRRRGWRVELSEDGTEIVSQIPPTGGGAA